MHKRIVFAKELLCEEWVERGHALERALAVVLGGHAAKQLAVGAADEAQLLGRVVLDAEIDERGVSGEQEGGEAAAPVF